VAANNARRAQRDPAQNPDAAAKAEIDRLNRQVAELTAERERLDFDNRIMWNASEEAKRIARETGAVSYAELDDSTRTAIVNPTQLRAQQQQAMGQQAAEAQYRQGLWAREVADRNAYGKASRSDAISDVYAAIAEAGLKANRDEVVKLFNDGYEGDEMVKA